MTGLLQDLSVTGIVEINRGHSQIYKIVIKRHGGKILILKQKLILKMTVDCF